MPVLSTPPRREATVRQLFGHERFEHEALVPLMNRVYENWNLLRNHFHPTFKLKSKHKQGSRSIRRYEKPRTPYHRLLDSPQLAPLTKHRLKQAYAQLNPFALKKQIEQDLKIVFTALGNLNREATNP